MVESELDRLIALRHDEAAGLECGDRVGIAELLDDLARDELADGKECDHVALAFVEAAQAVFDELTESGTDRDVTAPTPDAARGDERAGARRFGHHLVQIERIAAGDPPESPRGRGFDLAPEHPAEQLADVVRSEWLQVDALRESVAPEGGDRVLDRLAGAE